MFLILPQTPTFSSVPSLQSWSPSQIHSCTRHSLLWGQRCLVVHTGALVQPSSSERSQQSGWPSQCITADTHWPLVHLNSLALHTSSATERKGHRYDHIKIAFTKTGKKLIHDFPFPHIGVTTYHSLPRRCRPNSPSLRHRGSC